MLYSTAGKRDIKETAITIQNRLVMAVKMIFVFIKEQLLQ